MTDQTKHGIDFVQSSNKARMYEEKKKKDPKTPEIVFFGLIFVR